MKIIVTGASGFLGKVLCKRLHELGHVITPLSSKNADLTHRDSLNSWNHEKFDRITHLAAWTQAGDFSIFHPGEQWLINQQINTTVLIWWQKYQPQAKLVSIGTSCSYEDSSDDLEESNYLTGLPREEFFTYALTKRMLLIGQMAIQKQFGLTHLTCIPSTLYGPGYHTGQKQMHFIFDLIRKFLDMKHHGTEVILWGDGSQRRELIFVDDFVDLLLELDKKIENEIVNIGAGEDYSIREFAEKICHILDLDPSCVKYDTTRYVGAKVKRLSIKKIDNILPNRVKTPLDEGLRQTVRWMEEELF